MSHHSDFEVDDKFVCRHEFRIRSKETITIIDLIVVVEFGHNERHGYSNERET